MNRQDAKLAAIRQAVRQSLAPNQTPRIPDLACKPGTGTALVTPVPANLPVPLSQPRNPVAMSAEQVAFLCLRHFPARLNLWQTATLLGMTEDDVRRLIKEGILEPINEGPGTMIYFALVQVLAIRDSYEHVKGLTQTMNRAWRFDNREKAKTALTKPRSAA